MRLFAATLTVVTLSVMGAPASAGLRCGHELVQEGDSAAELLLKCGEPLIRSTIALENTSTTQGIVEQWTYSFGPGKFLRIVTIEAGRVASIENGDRQ